MVCAVGILIDRDRFREQVAGLRDFAEIDEDVRQVVEGWCQFGRVGRITGLSGNILPVQGFGKSERPVS